MASGSSNSEGSPLISPAAARGKDLVELATAPGNQIRLRESATPAGELVTGAQSLAYLLRGFKPGPTP
ncbi:hypothetical protein [Streptomyces sp. NPDC058695]|uniref:hypothetical protein n=1 Tax=Streptomyces sp. NPDC058695 TaxID=3346604 RepID=UPI00365C2C0E